MQVFGTVTSLIKTIALQHKAQEKINNPLMEKKSSVTVSSKKEGDQISISARIDSIKSKLKSGQKLTGSDLEFLKKNAPTLYEKAVKIAKEREEYQRRLGQCKSKEEVRRLNMEKIQAIGTEVKSVSNSSMDDGAKLEAMEFLQMRLAGVTSEHNAFVASDGYKRLPERSDEAKKKKHADKNDLTKKKTQEILEELLRTKDKLSDLFPGEAKEAEEGQAWAADKEDSSAAPDPGKGMSVKAGAAAVSAAPDPGKGAETEASATAVSTPAAPAFTPKKRAVSAYERAAQF